MGTLVTMWGRRDQESLARLIESEGLSDERIARAFRRIARENFVPKGARAEAYQDRPIPIPEQQTTSQPSLIARMIDAAAPREGDRVLEVGTGYGFQTALLASLAREVFSIERHAELAETAAENLKRAGITNAEVRVGDGWLGYPDEAPYDAIVVSAAASGVPPALAAQLAEGGRLVIPLAGALGDEVWLLVEKGGRVERVAMITPARFVPLVQDVQDEP